jgi:hypothetical protein
MGSKRVTGLNRGGVAADGSDVHFALARPNGEAFELVANTAAAEQITAALARLSAEASGRRAGQLAPRAAETVHSFEVQRDRLGNAILLLLISDRGVQYSFALSPSTGSDIADRLKSESGSAPPVGNA